MVAAMRYGGGGLFVVVSLVMLPIGLLLLAQARRWLALTVVCAYLVGYPLLLVELSHISDDHLRLWTVMVAVMFAVPWIAAGPIVYGIATRAPGKWYGEDAKPPSRRIQVRGFVVFAIGATAWVIGAFTPGLSRTYEGLLLAIALYGLLLGGFWLLGRELNQ
jgi:hypothetical protein